MDVDTRSSFGLWGTSLSFLAGFASPARFACLVCFACLTTCSGKSATSDDSVLERNHHPSRDGHYVQPTLTKAGGGEPGDGDDLQRDLHRQHVGVAALSDNGPGGKGLFFAVTNGNDVFALDETTGATVWTKNIGTAPAKTGQSAATSRRSASSARQ